jgi:2-polyprenyl-3-methyl-5-hydroxy-6-metoxy-1,4-benzoquinol methylase
MNQLNCHQMADDFSSTPVELWDSVAEEYQAKSYEGQEGLYPANSFRTEILSEYFKAAPKGKILDAGCGTGDATRMLLSSGWDVTSVDYSPKMVEVAKRLTEEKGLSGKFAQCSLQQLSSLNDKFDYVMLNGVLPYISLEEEPGVFEQIRQVSTHGACLIASHYNLFFDLFGYDRWSVAAIKTGILEDAGLDKTIAAKAAEKVTSLLASPEHVVDKERTMKLEDPLAYRQKLKTYGFEEFDQAYYNFFYMPYRFEAEQDQQVRSDMERRLRRTSSGLLLARTFVSFSKRVA